MLTDNFETHAQRFLEPSLSPKDRLALAQEIRESIEIVQTSEYGNFLQHFVGAFNLYLRGTSTESSEYYVSPEERFNTEAPSYRTRQVLLEILNRVPTTEVLRPFAPNLLQLCMHLLDNDDEENAVIALRIILDLHKTYRAQRPQPGPLEGDVQPFLNFVKQVYENFANTLKESFTPKPVVAGQPPKPVVRRSKESFKVVTECPLIVMFLFQLYDTHAPANVKTLLPLMVSAINLRAPQNARREHTALYQDFIAAQVKTLSFLTYLLRGSAEWVRPHKETIPISVVQLLVSCPHDLILVRKELLVATRHILSTDFREGFFKHADIFLDERTLVGAQRGAGDTLRPLAYSLLAEIVHHVRLSLKMEQLSKAVHLFSRNVHDASLPLTVQTTSIRLLMNLVEGIYHKHNSDQERAVAAAGQPGAAGQAAAAGAMASGESVKGRKLLVRILDTFVRKFGTLKEYTRKLVDVKGADADKLEDPKVQLEFMPFRSGSLSDITIDVTKEITDCKQLIKTLIVAVRTVVWSVSNVKNQGVARGMQEHECLITAKLLKHGLKCFGVYSSDDAAGAKEEKEILELFAGVFTVLDERTFRDVFTLNMQTLFDNIVNKETCLSIPQHFLSNASVTRIFTEILLQFLVSRMKDLSTGSRQETTTMLNLFKIVFMGVSTFPENEAVLRLHIRGVVGSCLRHAMQEQRPIHYYMLLKTLFRAVTSGKFELLMKEFISLLKSLIESLCKLLAASQEEETKELLLELCLSVPSRLNFLFPHIPLLMKPLVQALNSTTPELIHLGLKKLEAWVDSLQPAYLDPLLQVVKDDLMPAIYKQLQSGNNTFAVAAIRILGKLGGRNRLLLRDQAMLEGKEQGEEGIKISVQLPRNGGGFVPVELSIDDAIKTSLMYLEKSGLDAYYKKQCVDLIKSAVGLVLPPLEVLDDAMETAPTIAEDLAFAESQLLVTTKSPCDSDRGEAKAGMCKKILAAVFHLSTIADCEEEIQPYLEGVCRYFAASVALVGNRAIDREGPAPEAIFLEVAIEVLCKDQKARNDRKPGRAPPPQDTAKQPLDIFLRYLKEMTTPEEAGKLPVYEQIARQLCHMCYQKLWWLKVAGSVGLEMLVKQMPAAPLLQMELAIARALCAIWKESAADEIAITAERSYVALAHVLRRCHASEAQGGLAWGGDLADQEKSSFKEVMSFLGLELCAPNLTVRSNAQKIIGEVSEFMAQPASSILEPFKASMSQQIFKRRLTNFPVAVQIAHIDALTFCLSLQPPFMFQDPGLTQLLQDALNIAEMDDSNMQQAMRHSHDGAAVTQLSVLRTHCVQLLRTAMASEEVNLATNSPELRNNIILMFFKVITKGFPDAVIAAREGLAVVLQTQRGKAPFKDLLQSSLRPVLVNLADYRKLTVHLLDGLSRLLELLSSWFNVTLGEKLLDYLQKWAETDKAVAPGTPKPPTKAGDEPKIPAAIIELFHLLPPAPGKFIEKLARLTIELEAKLPSTGDFSSVRSPYRAPFTKFLNRFPGECLQFFYDRLLDPQLNKLLHHVLRSPMAHPVRDEVRRSEDKLIACTLMVDSSNPNHNELRFQGIQIVRTVSKFYPDWLSSRPKVLEHLIRIWQAPERWQRLSNEEGLEFEHLLESKSIIKCLLSYARTNPQDHKILFCMLNIFTVRSVVDYSFVKQFYAKDVATGFDLRHRKKIIVEFLNNCKDPAVPQDIKVQALQLVVIPTLTAAFNSKDPKERGIIDEATINLIVKDLLDPGDEVLKTYDESLHIELLQLATLLVRYLKEQLVSHRKELIKFAWDRLKREDSTSKHWAYVNVCRFIEAYDAPHKIILQVYVALLRAFQPESRPLLKQALDILTPALPKRLPPAEHKYPIWIRYTKKIIVEEGHSLPHLIHIWHFLVRHSDLFYSSRAQFVPQMVNSLNRIGMANTCPVENRKLAIDLADLVISWDCRRVAENASTAVAKVEPGTGAADAGGDKMEVDGAASAAPAAAGDAAAPAAAGDGKEVKRELEGDDGTGQAAKKMKTESGGAVATQAAPAAAPAAAAPAAAGATPAAPAAGEGAKPAESGKPEVDDYKPNSTMIEMVVNFLMRVALITAEPKETAALSERCVKLLDKALGIWQGAVLKFQYFEKVIEKSENHPANLHMGLEIFNVLLERQMVKVVNANSNAVRMLLTACQPCENVKVNDAVKRLVELYVNLPAPNDTSEHSVAFMSWLKELVDKGLLAVNTTQTTGRVDRAQIHNAERILLTLAKKKPEVVDAYAPTLVKIVQKFTREHHAHMVQARQGNRQAEPVAEDVVENTAKVLIMGIQLLAPRLNVLGDNRKIFLLAVSMLIERSTVIERQGETSVLAEVASTVGAWIADPDSGMKPQEKANFVHKMMSFEQLRKPTPYTTYLQMIYDLVSNPNPPNPELVSKVQRAWMIGLRCRDPTLRKSFFTFFESQVPKALYSRVQHVIQKQDWDSIGDGYWLKHGVELILNMANMEARVQEVSESPERVSSIATELKGKRSKAALEAFAANDAFLNERYQTTTGALLTPLCELLHNSNALTHAIWTQLFPTIWSSLTPDEQQGLTKPLGMLVARDCNKFQDLRRPNVVQGLLEAIHRCKPTPNIAPAILRFAGRTFNAWHSALSILEDQILRLQYADGGQKSEADETMDVLSDLYRRLGEHDVMCGLWCRQSAAMETKVGVSYIQFGYWQKAQDIFLNAMTKCQGGGISNATKAEKIVWEEQWIACAKQLNQWEVLKEYATDVNQFDLLLESCWKTDSWMEIKEALADPMPSDASQTKIYEIYNALQEWRLPDAEKHCNDAFQYALKNWCLFPDVAVHAYVPLMQTFHQLVELHESALMLDEVNKSIRHNSVPELKNTIQAWRERLPNKWDETTVWHELLTWRNHVFKMLTETNQSSPDIKQALLVCGQHEESWTLIKFSESARKQGLPQLCIQNLQKIMSFQSMDVQHAYTKTREEVLSRIDLGTTQELHLGMNAINKINLDYFNANQKGEILRLKGEFLSRLPDPRNVGQARLDEANQAFSTALGTAEQHGKAWVSWGNLWETQMQAKAERNMLDEKSRAQWSEYIVNCYLQGVRCGSDRARMLLSRVLWIIDTQEDNTGVSAEFDKNVELVPSWNWVFWVPLLLGALARPQAPRFRKLLTKLAGDYPQALYCPLRRFLIEKQGQSRAAEGSEMPAAAAAAAANATATAATAASADAASTPAPAAGAAAAPADAAAAAAPVPAAAAAAAAAPEAAAAAAPAAPPAPDAAAATAPAAAATPAAAAAPPAVAAAPAPAAPGAAPAAAAPAAAAAAPAGGGDVKMEDSTKTAAEQQAASEARAAMIVRQHAQEIMKHLRDTHLPFFLETERFVVEITRSFKPTQEQQLHHVVSALLESVQRRELSDDVTPEDATRIETTFTDMLVSCDQLIEAELAKTAQAAKDATAAGTPAPSPSKEVIALQGFISEYRPLINAQFIRSSGAELGKYQDIFLKLRKWQIALKRQLRRSAFPRQLEVLSRTLAESKGSQMEVPGQYLPVREPMPDQHIKVDRVLPDIDLAERCGAVHRRITIRGSDGKLYHFIVEATGSTIATGDERTIQLFQLLNRCMDKEKQTRRRHMKLNVKPIVGLAPRCRLLADVPRGVSLHNALSSFLSGIGQTPDAVAINFHTKAQLLAARNTPDPLMASMNEIADLIPDTVLLDHVRSQVPTNDLLWSFRKHFSTQYGCSVLCAYALQIPSASPERLIISQKQGHVTLASATSTIGSDLAGAHMPLTVPFRLTRMLTTIISPIGLEGGFSAAIGAGAMALSNKNRQLKHHMYVLLREHLHAQSTSKPAQTPAAQSEHNRGIVSAASTYAGQVVERVTSLSPSTAYAKSLETKDSELPPPLNYKVIELIRAAADPHQQMQMPPLWHPWA